MAAMHSPLEQFEIKPLIPLHLGDIDVSITNSTLWMAIGISAVTVFMISAMRSQSLVPGRMQSMAELAYEFIANLIRENAGNQGRVFFPYIFTLFMFIFAMNVLGTVPGSFTVTSHIVVTFTLAFCTWAGITVFGFMKHGPKYLKLFVPSGVPFALVPPLVVIELLSYLIRPFSLSIRLFANMMAGHTMLKVFASFVVMLGVLGGWAPLVLLIALTGLEIGIAMLQAYVFTVLTCIYLNDAIHPGH